MTEPWNKNPCPQCGRESDRRRMVATDDVRKVHHVDSAGHTWTTTWMVETRTAA